MIKALKVIGYLRLHTVQITKCCLIGCKGSIKFHLDIVAWNVTPVYFGAGQSGLETSYVICCEIWPHRLKSHSQICFSLFWWYNSKKPSDNYICCNNKKVSTMPRSVWNVSHKNVFSLNNNKRLVFIIDKNCVLCEARTEFYMSGRTWILKTLDGADGRRPVSAESRDWSQENGCVICGRRSDTGTDLSQFFLGFTMSLLFHRFSIIIFQSSSSSAI
jgi:hypothetical protein